MIEIEIKNLENVMKVFKQFPIAMKRNLSDAILKSAYTVEGKAKEITPVDTGRLRNSIYTKISPLEALVSTNVGYAVFIHEGTKRYPLSMSPKSPMAVRQFMKVGAERSKALVESYFREALEKTIKQSTNV